MPTRVVYDYEYPDVKSYNMFGLPSRQVAGNILSGNETRLARGYMFSYSKEGREDPKTRRIQFDYGKAFQFNPSELNIHLSMSAAESASLQTPGGNYTSNVGLATTDLKLIFDRTQEVAKANDGRGNDIFRYIGAQKDLFDIYDILTGGVENATDTAVDTSDFPDVRASSTNKMTKAMMDSVAGGSTISMLPFAIVFNDNLALHINRVTEFNFSYIRFTRDMIPTNLVVVMSLEIMNMSSTLAVAQNVSGLTPDTGTTGGGVTNPNLPYNTGPNPGPGRPRNQPF